MTHRSRWGAAPCASSRSGTYRAAPSRCVLVDEMARHGFDPEVRRDGGSIEVILRSCPFVSAVLTDPGTVCDLHLGLAQGVADEVGGLVVDALVPHDPRRARCVLRCHESTPGETPGV